MAKRELTRMKRNLKRALKALFPEENMDRLIELLSLATEKGGLSYDEIEMQEDVKVDLLLLLEMKRMLIPLHTSKTLAWEDRLLTFKPGEIYEMPHVIRYLIRNAKETGKLKPDHAIRMYLKEIGESEIEKIIALFNEVKKNAKQNKVTSDILLRASEKLNLKERIGTIIAELKGGGIISPCLRDPSHLRYEVNPSLTP